MEWFQKIWKLVFGIFFIVVGILVMPGNQLVGYIAVGFGLFNIIWFLLGPKNRGTNKNANTGNKK